MSLNNKIPIPSWAIMIFVSLFVAALTWGVSTSVSAGKTEVKISALEKTQDEEKIKTDFTIKSVAILDKSNALLNAKMDNLKEGQDEIKLLLKEHIGRE